MNLLYVNVYAVTRHYGGPEEGGWWYNAGQLLASVPIEATQIAGHPQGCGECDEARFDQSPAGLCRQDPSEEWIQETLNYLSDERAQAGVSVDEDSLRQELYQSKLFREQQKPIFHLAPANEKEKDEIVARMTELFRDQKWGDIYSVRGGVDVQVSVEDKVGANWSDYRPYE